MVQSKAFLFQKCIPFAVVGCNTVVEVNGKRIRGRVYPWGIVEGQLEVTREGFLSYQN